MVKFPYGSIRRYIAGWAGAIVLAFLLLSGGLLYAIAMQHTVARRIYVDSLSLQTNHAFETAIVDEGRQDLLWTLTRQNRYREASARLLGEADVLLSDMKSQADAGVEARLVLEIDREYSLFRQAVTAAPRPSPDAQAALDTLLTTLDQDRDLNAQQMLGTMRYSGRIDRIVAILAVLVIGLATGFVVAGSIELWRRIVLPAISLVQAARAFGSNLQVRAPVLREDEMGQIAHTFNSMAEIICDREKERLRFVATVAHDLKNPLVVIGGAAHLLRNKELRLTAEERAEWLGNIVINANRLEDMIGDLVDGVQAETGQLAFDMKCFDLNAVAAAMVAEHAATATGHLVRYNGYGECRVNGDRKRLERVLMNLLSNATKYSQRGSEVELTLRSQGRQAQLTVRDEGAGIAPADIPKLFQPFARLERTRNMAGGTGLGLASVKKIVEGHGGTIGISSVLDQGTTVTVTLPLAEG